GARRSEQSFLELITVILLSAGRKRSAFVFLGQRRMGKHKQGRVANSRPDISSSAGCSMESRQGSSVITKGKEFFSKPGFCSRESMLRSCAARICASRATIPGWSRTKKRKYHAVSKSLDTIGLKTWLPISLLPPESAAATNITSDTTATAVGSPPAP